MKLEYRVLEIAEGDKQDCNYCSLDFLAEIGFNLNIATHEIAANNKEGDCVDIAYICATCKEGLENNILPYCEKCGSRVPMFSSVQVQTCSVQMRDSMFSSNGVTGCSNGSSSSSVQVQFKKFKRFKRFK